jgi:hypothetical protein
MLLPFSDRRLPFLFHPILSAARTFIELMLRNFVFILKIHILSTAVKVKYIPFHAVIYHKCHPKLSGSFFFTTVKVCAISHPLCPSPATLFRITLQHQAYTDSVVTARILVLQF